jgi:hypothetical protein
MKKVLIPGFLLLGLCSPALGGPAQARIQCDPAGSKLVYDCRIALTDQALGTPVSKAEFTVLADMPSMPMAHNVRPVPAVETETPGTYHAALKLEMYGTWAIRLRISQPAPQQIDQKLDFFK